MISHDDFRESLLSYFDELRERVETESGDWTVKGFIDVYQRIYTISLDTKVLSKVLELLMLPLLVKFAQEHGYEMMLARQQNQYPDISWIAPNGTKYAMDIKNLREYKQSKQQGAAILGIADEQLESEVDEADELPDDEI